MSNFDADVLVVGMGPVGSTGALYLAREGLRVIGVDPLPKGATDLRASTFHSPTLEILDKLGAADLLHQNGLVAPVYQFIDQESNEAFRFDMGELADQTRFPYRLQCEQQWLSNGMIGLLRSEPGADLRMQQRLLYLEQDDTGVTSWIEDAVSVRKIRTRFVIGADGASSTVRKLLGIGFDGFTYAEKFLCLSTADDIAADHPGLCAVNYISNPDMWAVLLQVPGFWRILVPAPEDEPDEVLLSDDNKDAVFRKLLGSDRPITTRHRTIYRVHQRVADRFVQGRVALAGDAAHVNSPVGGYGMNSGIHDVVNLADKLVEILQRDATLDLLARYERQRQAVTREFVQAQTIENTRLMREGWGSVRAERRDRMDQLANDPGSRREFLLRTAMFRSLEQAANIQ
ncbi:FAD-dependent monooxygenase [Luteimonas composti]|uniref:FAD-dependent monooxygenase n=1 Tax=Luteimonas composti TaxID=398257 RepID=A0ABT6MNQ3_9GAMM|nr:FAD-dependent monooxygenase [Luteimonas composti]MDH7452226.1 FAD-dependent monooxygenase [Luteimonas composti]